VLPVPPVPPLAPVIPVAGVMLKSKAKLIISWQLLPPPVLAVNVPLPLPPGTVTDTVPVAPIFNEISAAADVDPGTQVPDDVTESPCPN
jgi:hypothetical protein